jgi:hypothetical protein
MIKSLMIVPSNQAEDINAGYTEWRDGKYIAIDEGDYITYYIGHTSTAADIWAYPIRTMKPVSRANLICAAEMQAYGLVSSMEVASLGASLSRKYRENNDDPEVKEHDEFIRWVKNGLTAIGM